MPTQKRWDSGSKRKRTLAYLLQLLPRLGERVDGLALHIEGTVQREVPHAFERAHHIAESVVLDDARPRQLQRY